MNNKQLTTSLLLGSAALLCALGAQAQAVYRIVGPDGKVTFSDKPPANAQQGKIATTGVGAAAASSNSNLPFELRQVTTKYPVVLYTSAQCAPCDSGRALLTSRGVPFNERTIITNEDRAALQRQMGDTSLPYLTIGGQRVRGLSESEWTQYLDAAGYPKTSALPAGYKNAAPSPLVPLPTGTPAPKAPEKAAAASEPVAPPPPTVNPANPAGITF
jgi:glutaredoxin|nr:glutaredoxin domain-containing protein [uncultured Rhodoferax sp.]